MKQSLITSSVYLTVSSVIFMLSAYITNIFLGRYLGPEDYGTYGIIISLMTAVNLIQTAGLPQAVSKYIAQHEDKSNEILKSGLILQLLSTIVITAVYFSSANQIALLLNDVRLIPYLQLSAFIFPMYGIYALYSGYYNGLHDFKRQTLITIIYSVVKAISVVTLALLSSLSGAIAGFIIAPFFSILTALKLPKIKGAAFSYKKLLMFSAPLIGFAFLATLLQSIDLYFIKALILSDKDPGFYTANQNIARIPFFAFSALAIVLFPSVSKNIQNNQINIIQNMISKSMRYMFMFLVPGIFIAIATSRELLELIYSQAYLPGAESLSILLIGSGFFTIFYTLANILNGAGSANKSVICTSLGIIIVILLCFILIPLYGLKGAALATTISTFITMILVAVIVYKKFGVLISGKSALKIICASFFIYFLAKILILPFIFLPLLYFFLFAIYFLILFILGEISKTDTHMVKSFIPNSVRRKLNL